MGRDTVLQFASFRLEPDNARLWHGAHALKLKPKAFAVLRYLAEHADQLVSKDELWQAVWPEVTVSDDVLTACIRDIRKALGDNAQAPQFIETVHRRGYRFIAPLSTTTPLVQSSTFKVSSSQSPIRIPHSAINLVGREAELTQLHRWLAKALDGERQIVFVTGEPGIGKTTLVEAFLAGIRVQGLGNSGPASTDPQSLAPDPSLGREQCIEQYGAGEPYMPILEALGRLCREPGGHRLIAILHHHAPTWLVQMPALLNVTELEVLRRQASGATQQRMLREVAEAVEAMTAEHPLVLWLEDLHWSDPSTVTLLSLLARRQDPARLLLIRTYRPEELQATSHPLHDLLQDLLAHQHCHGLPLSLLTKDAVAEYVQTRFPGNMTPLSFAPTLHQQTEGQPFFLNSMLNDLIARQVLAEVEGTWILTQDLATVTAQVPESVQQLIARQQARLQPMEQRVLEAASLAGQEFAVAAVAAALATDVIEVGDQCAQLARRQQFLQPAGVAEWPDSTVTTRYHFQHALYQQLWHERISIERRQQWHLRIGERLEAAYGKRAQEIATELAVHFEQGRDYGKALSYLQQAGRNAVRRSAYEEAIRHLTRGLELLKTLPDTPARVQLELTLQLALGTPLVATKSWASPEVERHYIQARELCQQLGETQQLFSVLAGQWAFYALRAEHTTARTLAEQLPSLAQKVNSRPSLVLAHEILGFTLFFLGEFPLARDHMEQCSALYDPQKDSPLVSGVVNDPKVQCLSFEAWTLCLLGYPDQALKRIHKALTLAQELAHPYSLAYALAVAARLDQFRRAPRAVQDRADVLITLSREQGFPHWLAEGIILRGWALAEQGQRAEGIAQIRQGLTTWRATGLKYLQPHFLTLLAEICRKGRLTEEGLSVVAEALALVEQTGERVWEAELYRLKGELLLAQEGKGQKAGSAEQGARSREQK